MANEGVASTEGGQKMAGGCGDCCGGAEGGIPEGAPEGCGGPCSSCGIDGCGSREGAAGAAFSKLETNGRTNVKKLIAVVSGKGGVGKSLVTSLLASELSRQGKSVAILDADITGPSIPRSFGVHARPVADADGLIPVTSESGIKMMSANLLLPEEDTPVAWRGPVVTNALTQFWTDVSWGDVDVMLIDMPPGTSDVFLTICQMLPVDGIVTVSAPQDLVGMIVGKAVNLAGSLDVPVIGLVENMSYYECDECGKRHHVFGEPQGQAVADKYGIGAVASLPIDPTIAELVDAGNVERVDAADFMASMLEAIDRA